MKLLLGIIIGGLIVGFLTQDRAVAEDPVIIPVDFCHNDDVGLKPLNPAQWKVIIGGLG